MGYFAKVEDGMVTNVIVADQEFIDAGHVDGVWLETTFDALGGVVYEFDDSIPPQRIPTDKPSVRKNYANIGYTYDAQRDAFIPPKPLASWVLNENTCLWEPPIPKPQEGNYRWDEETISWVERQPKENNNGR